MGYYVNPPHMQKERWLRENGQVIPFPEGGLDDHPDKGVVCLVDNGMFTAAGVCVDEREFNDFSLPDGRPKTWFVVDRKMLQPVTQPDLSRVWKELQE